MNFAFPAVFIAPLIYLGLRLIARRGIQTSLATPSASLLKSLPVSLRLRLRTPILLALELATITTLTVAAARPQRVTIIEQPNLARNIMLVIDASNSMSGEDFPTKFGATSRMEGVKTVVAEYVRSRRGDRVGLVVFGNTSYLQSPLTNDTLLVEKLVEQLQPRMAGDGTAIGDGLGLALKRLRDVEARSKAIILMTDGVNTAGQVSPLKAAQIAKDLGIQIHTIGIGTGTVTLSQDPFGGLLGVAAGPKAEFDEATLKEIAKMTGGVYFNATSLEGFKDVYRQIDELNQTETQQPQQPIIHELFTPWACAAFISLCASILLQSTVFRRIP
jgi:Ca-activated chloride channel family protein